MKITLRGALMSMVFGILVGLFSARMVYIYLYESSIQSSDSSSNAITTFSKALDLSLSTDYPITNFALTKETAIAFVSGLLTVLLIYFYKISSAKVTRHGEEHGSAEWGTPKDIAPFIAKKPQDNILLTNTEKLSMSNRMTITKTDNFNRNKNVVVVGGAGSGKTRFYVTPNLLQLHSSYMISDSKGLLYKEFGNYFRENGYVVKVIDLVTRKNTNHYNPFQYIKNEDDILKLIDNLIQNTTNQNKKGGDDFWEKSEKALLLALFGYLLENVREEERTMSLVADLVRLGTVKEDNEDFVSVLDELFETLSKESFAYKQYGTFKLSSAKTAKSILISTSVRLAPFTVPSIKRLLSDDNLELETLGDKKTALFFVLPDSNSTFNFIIAMLYQQSLDLLIDRADNFYNGSLPVHVRLMLDEFANTGQIPEFDKAIATIRSRNISANVILQSISQIKNLYKDTWESIIATSDTLLYLGGNESSTHKYVSEQLGKQTIDVTTYNETKGANGSFTINNNKLGRVLLDQSEVSRLNGGKCILFLRGVKPFLSDKFALETHANYKKYMEFQPNQKTKKTKQKNKRTRKRRLKNGINEKCY